MRIVGVPVFVVMSNHLHLVVELAPDVAERWSDDEVAARWVRLFPPREHSGEAISAKHSRLTAQPDRLRMIRSRLADLSWLMRCLAEPIARRANREDSCKGRFWEGRFKAQRLCDERALLAAMAYVDLNPVRAGIATGLHDSSHTSILTRLAGAESAATGERRLQPILGVQRIPLSITEHEYLQLVDWTGRQLAPGKRGAIPADAPPVLARLSNDSVRWPRQVRGVGSGYWRAVGSVEALMALAKQMGQRWLKGQGFAASVG